jgi:hypothetical protein
MRFMMILRADAGSVPGRPSIGGIDGMEVDGMEVDGMERYNEELIMDGVLLAYEQLYPSATGARVEFSGPEARSVATGPVSASEAPITRFWIVQAASQDEALERARRAPCASGRIEVLQVFEPSER